MIKIAAIVTAVVVSLIVIITMAVAKSASGKPESGPSPIYKYRSPYFYFLVISIIGLLYITLKSDRIPYAETKSGTPLGRARSGLPASRSQESAASPVASQADPGNVRRLSGG